MTKPAGSSIRFGLPLVQPVDQTILPFITPEGSIPGFLVIAKQTFGAGIDYASVSLPGVTLVATTVTIPSQGKDGTGMMVDQYMATLIPQEEVYKKPWLGFPDLITPEESGYYSWYSAPTTGLFHHFGRGTLLQALYTSMDTTPPNRIPAQPGGPEEEAPIITWAASVNKGDIAKLSFFDFSWLDLLTARLSPEELPQWASPTLTVLANPNGGCFKAVLVKGNSLLPGGAVIFDVVRIIKLQDPLAGTYPFTFLLKDRVSNFQKNCQLVLTVAD